MYKLQKQDMFQVPWKVDVFDTHTDVKCRFQEDGSFIGQYGTLRKQQMQQQVANAAAAAAAARAAAQAQAIGPGTYV